MRLLKIGRCGEPSLTEHFVHNTPPYALLPHTWGADNDEVTFDDSANGLGKSKIGCTKIEFCEETRKEGPPRICLDRRMLHVGTSPVLTVPYKKMVHLSLETMGLPSML